MHYIKNNVSNESERDTLSKSFGKYNSIFILSEKDIEDKCICLRGIVCDIILIPNRYYNPSDESLKEKVIEIKNFLYANLYNNGEQISKLGYY